MSGKMAGKALPLNILTSVMARLVVLITGLTVQHFILRSYGSTINGLTSSITQVMSYLVLFEAGLGTASMQALFDPLSRGDWGKVSGIIAATGVEYRKITAAFSVALLMISLVLPFLLKEQVEFAVASTLTFVTGGSYIVSYIVGGKYKAILCADRKMYVLYLLDIMSSTLSCVMRVVALRCGVGIVFVQAIHLGLTLTKNAGYILYVSSRYKRIDYKVAPDKPSIKKRWNVLIHSIAGLVVNHTDIMILTIFSSLKAVSVYSVYNMVFSQLSTAIQTTFVQAPQAHFGALYYSDRDKFDRMFRAYETIYTMVLFAICAVALIMIMPFVSVYTKGVTDAEYMDQWLPPLFAAILLLNLLRAPAVMAVNVTGAFKETQTGAIIEVIINLSVSLGLFFLTELGIYGLLIGTLCSYLFRTTDLISHIYKNIVRHDIRNFLYTIAINTYMTGLSYYIFCVKHTITTVGFAEWFVNAIVVAVMIGFMFIIGNFLFNRTRCMEAYNILIRQRKRPMSERIRSK